MRLPLAITVSIGVALGLALGACENECGAGTRSVAGQCRPLVSAEDDAGAGHDASGPASVPAMPVITGAPSSDPDHVLWTWTLPPDAVDVQVVLDDGAVQPRVQGDSASATELAEGPHTLSVAACNAAGGCSEPATHTTNVKRYGP